MGESKKKEEECTKKVQNYPAGTSDGYLSSLYNTAFGPPKTKEQERKEKEEYNKRQREIKKKKEEEERKKREEEHKKGAEKERKRKVDENKKEQTKTQSVPDIAAAAVSAKAVERGIHNVYSEPDRNPDYDTEKDLERGTPYKQTGPLDTLSRGRKTDDKKDKKKLNDDDRFCINRVYSEPDYDTEEDSGAGTSSGYLSSLINAFGPLTKGEEVKKKKEEAEIKKKEEEIVKKNQEEASKQKKEEIKKKEEEANREKEDEIKKKREEARKKKEEDIQKKKQEEASKKNAEEVKKKGEEAIKKKDEEIKKKKEEASKKKDEETKKNVKDSSTGTSSYFPAAGLPSGGILSSLYNGAFGGKPRSKQEEKKIKEEEIRNKRDEENKKRAESEKNKKDDENKKKQFNNQSVPVTAATTVGVKAVERGIHNVYSEPDRNPDNDTEKDSERATPYKQSGPLDTPSRGRKTDDKKDKKILNDDDRYCINRVYSEPDYDIEEDSGAGTSSGYLSSLINAFGPLTKEEEVMKKKEEAEINKKEEKIVKKNQEEASKKKKEEIKRKEEEVNRKKEYEIKKKREEARKKKEEDIQKKQKEASKKNAEEVKKKEEEAIKKKNEELKTKKEEVSKKKEEESKKKEEETKKILKDSSTGTSSYFPVARLPSGGTLSSLYNGALGSKPRSKQDEKKIKEEEIRKKKDEENKKKAEIEKNKKDDENKKKQINKESVPVTAAATVSVKAIERGIHNIYSEPDRNPDNDTENDSGRATPYKQSGPLDTPSRGRKTDDKKDKKILNDDDRYCINRVYSEPDYDNEEDSGAGTSSGYLSSLINAFGPLTKEEEVKKKKEEAEIDKKEIVKSNQEERSNKRKEEIKKKEEEANRKQEEEIKKKKEEEASKKNADEVKKKEGEAIKKKDEEIKKKKEEASKKKEEENKRNLKGSSIGTRSYLAAAGLSSGGILSSLYNGAFGGKPRSKEEEKKMKEEEIRKKRAEESKIREEGNKRRDEEMKRKEEDNKMREQENKRKEEENIKIKEEEKNKRAKIEKNKKDGENKKTPITKTPIPVVTAAAASSSKAVERGIHDIYSAPDENQEEPSRISESEVNSPPLFSPSIEAFSIQHRNIQCIYSGPNYNIGDSEQGSEYTRPKPLDAPSPKYIIADVKVPPDKKKPSEKPITDDQYGVNRMYSEPDYDTEKDSARGTPYTRSGPLDTPSRGRKTADKKDKKKLDDDDRYCINRVYSEPDYDTEEDSERRTQYKPSELFDDPLRGRKTDDKKDKKKLIDGDRYCINREYSEPDYDTEEDSERSTPYKRSGSLDTPSRGRKTDDKKDKKKLNDDDRYCIHRVYSESDNDTEEDSGAGTSSGYLRSLLNAFGLLTKEEEIKKKEVASKNKEEDIKTTKEEIKKKKDEEARKKKAEEIKKKDENASKEYYEKTKKNNEEEASKKKDEENKKNVKKDSSTGNSSYLPTAGLLSGGILSNLYNSSFGGKPRSKQDENKIKEDEVRKKKAEENKRREKENKRKEEENRQRKAEEIRKNKEEEKEKQSASTTATTSKSTGTSRPTEDGLFTTIQNWLKPISISIAALLLLLVTYHTLSIIYEHLSTTDFGVWRHLQSININMSAPFQNLYSTDFGVWRYLQSINMTAAFRNLYSTDFGVWRYLQSINMTAAFRNLSSTDFGIWRYLQSILNMSALFGTGAAVQSVTPITAKTPPPPPPLPPPPPPLQIKEISESTGVFGIFRNRESGRCANGPEKKESCLEPSHPIPNGTSDDERRAVIRRMFTFRESGSYGSEGPAADKRTAGIFGKFSGKDADDKKSAEP